MKRSFLFARATILTCTFLLGCFFCTVSASADTCSTNDCHADMVTFQFAHAALEEDGCFSCHEQVQDQHPLAQGASFKLLEDGAKLCYQCHDRFGKKLTIHDPVKDGSCTDCHNPHGSNEGRFLLPVAHSQTDLCLNCHDPEAFSQTVIHGPTASGACTQCHDPHEANNPVLLKRSRQKTCTGCHEEMAEGMANSPVIHKAVEETSCTSCHNPHSAPAAKLLQKDIEELCMDCHGDIGRKVKKAKIKHAALYREEKCSACHATHFSIYPGLLKQSEQDVCLSCHGKDDYKKSKPLKNIAKEIKDKKILHGPLQDGECSGCHNPHGSDHTRLLRGAYPKSFYFPYSKGSYDFCLECHDKNLLRFPETSIYTEFRNGKQNLHYLHVSNKYKGRSCRACHEPHAADLEKLMSEEGANFGDWNIPTRFIKTETGGSCSPGCHQTYDYDRDKPIDYEK